MTLILAMSKAEGIYLAADYRVSDGRTGATLDDASVKHLTVHYPPHGDGPKALLAYTGVAALKDGTRVGDWIRETVRGECEVFDDSMKHLQRRLDRDLAGLREPLNINALVVHGARRYVGALSNQALVDGTIKLRSTFGYAMHELTEPIVFANGSGAAPLIADPYLDKVKGQLTVRPRGVLDHMKLLATANRRVAAVDRRVSPHCHVSFINADDTFSPTSHVFADHGVVVPFTMPMVLLGIDLSFMAEHTMEFAKRGDGSVGADDDKLNESVRRRP